MSYSSSSSSLSSLNFRAEEGIRSRMRKEVSNFHPQMAILLSMTSFTRELFLVSKTKASLSTRHAGSFLQNKFGFGHFRGQNRSCKVGVVTTKIVFSSFHRVNQMSSRQNYWWFNGKNCNTKRWTGWSSCSFSSFIHCYMHISPHEWRYVMTWRVTKRCAIATINGNLK